MLCCSGKDGIAAVTMVTYSLNQALEIWHDLVLGVQQGRRATGMAVQTLKR